MTWESRMAHRAKLATIKRRMKANLEGEPEPPVNSALFCCGVECGVGLPPDEWPELIGEGINPLRVDGSNYLKES